MSHQDSEQDDDSPFVFHDKSKWEEPPGDPYLTLWDIHRSPRTVEAMDANHRLRLPVKVLHPDFRCPICGGYLKKTTTVMECMHRFCEECIETSLRLVKKECPTCRIHVPSRRSLRSDTRFDKLIECILGDVEEQDRKETRQNELFNQGKLGKTRNAPMQTRRRQQQWNRKTPPEAKGRMEMPFVPLTSISGFEPSPLVKFFLVRHFQEKRLDPLLKDSIRMSGKAPISVLQTFLSHKLSYGPATDIQILFRMPPTTTFVILHPNLELQDVQKEHMCCCAEMEEMVLYYRISAFP